VTRAIRLAKDLRGLAQILRFEALFESSVYRGQQLLRSLTLPLLSP
jgi:hypothetical protein